MEKTFIEPNGAVPTQAKGGTTSTTSQLEISRRIAALTDLTAPQLRAEWRRLYRVQSPRLNRDLLIRTIAYRLH